MKRLLHHVTLTLSALVAAVVLTVVPVVASAQHVAAMSMAHPGMHTGMPPGVSACPQPASTGVLPEGPAFDEQEKTAPDPIPAESAKYARSQISPRTKSIKPTGVYADGLLRPPDMRLTIALMRL